MDASLVKRIRQLKEKHDAVILAHNYQLPEVQDVADYVGDSLGLSRQAAAAGARVIVFCGVRFMAETASILCPGKTVLLPDPDAGCPMVDMLDVEGLLKMKAAHPQALVVSYVNSSAGVKAESDYCCTSANAVKVVSSIDPDREVIFVPDKYLGGYVSAQTGRKMVLARGFCATHVRILEQDVLRARKEHPGAEVLVHPECRPEVVALADHVLSTSGMCRRARESSCEEMVIGTEIGLLHQLKKQNPDKKFYIASEAAVCPNMKRIDLERVLWALEDGKHEVRVPGETAARARRAVDRMVAAVEPGS